MKFSPMNFIRQRNASTESVQSHHSSEPFVSTSSAFYNLPMSHDSKDFQTPAPGDKKVSIFRSHKHGNLDDTVKFEKFDLWSTLLHINN